MSSNLKVILTSEAPQPIGPYSQAIESGNLLFCSGQVPLDPKTGEMIGKTPAEQAEQVMTNLEAVLVKAGRSFKDVAKTTIFLTSMSSFAEVNQVYEKRMQGHRPARSTVAVSALPKNALVEIECIAVR